MWPRAPSGRPTPLCLLLRLSLRLHRGEIWPRPPKGVPPQPSDLDRGPLDVPMKTTTGGRKANGPAQSPRGRRTDGQGLRSWCPGGSSASGRPRRAVDKSPLAAGGQGHRAQEHRGPGQAPPSPTGTGRREGLRVTPWWSPPLCHQLWKSGGRPAAPSPCGGLQRRGCAVQHGGRPAGRHRLNGFWVALARTSLPETRQTRVRVPECSQAPPPWPGEGRGAGSGAGRPLYGHWLPAAG